MRSTRTVESTPWIIVRLTWIGSGTLGSVPCRIDESTLTSGRFVAWVDGIPAEWVVQQGAKNGNGETSRLAPLESGGIALEGDADTGVCNTVSQSFPVRGRSCYRLELEARALNLRREANQ